MSTAPLHEMPESSVGVTAVTPRQVDAVAAGEVVIELDDAARARIRASHAVLERAVAAREVIYGVTTGFGPLASEWLAPELAGRVQANLVRHLASGVGRPLSPEQSRALLYCRLVVLAQGYSGVRLDTVERLVSVLNAGLAPVVPSLGTVGASGDLTPLAHATLCLCGEGEFWVGGERVDAKRALDAAGIEPLELERKEGLALVNGTSAMTGMAALNDVRAWSALEVALRVGALAADVFGAFEEAFDPLLAQVRGHRGQVVTAARLNHLLEGSRRLRRREGAPPDQVERHRAAHAPQDPYTIRCQQQLFGAVFDTVDFHTGIVTQEIGAVTDNPVFDASSGRVVHGGNFFGQHVAFASDALMTAVIQLAVWAERIVARFTDRNLNGGLPAFLTPRTVGLHSGFMGAQVTASALIAELRSKSVPASIQSVPTNANNQDVVTMGTISSLRVSEMLDRVFEVLAIATMVVVQARELSSDDGYSEASEDFVRWTRERIPALDEDRPLSAEITSLARQLQGWSGEQLKGGSDEA